MTFSDIQSVVVQLWEFAWPPVIKLAFLFFLIRWISPGLFENLERKIFELLNPSKVRRVRALLKVYGLSSVQSFLVAFTLVFSLYITNQIASLVGSLIPPDVTYTPQILIAKYGDRASLACLSAKFSSGPQDVPASNIGESDTRHAIEYIEDRISKQDSHEQRTYWENQAGEQYQWLTDVKFFAFFVFLLVVFEGWRHRNFCFRRFFVIVTILAVAYGVFLTRYLYATEQAYLSSITAVSREVYQGEVCEGRRNLNLSDVQSKLLDGMVKEGWWHFGAGYSHYLDWVERSYRDGI